MVVWRGLAVVLLCGAGCASELAGESAKPRTIYFPVGLTAQSDGSHVYVVSSNFDLRFNSGWVSSLDVDCILGLDDARAAGTDLGAVDCPLAASQLSARSVFGRAIAGQLLVPSLGGHIELDDTGNTALLTVRGEQPLTRIDIAAERAKMSCGDPEATAGLSSLLEKTDCDEEHLLSLSDMRTELQATLPDALSATTEIGRAIVADPFPLTMFRRPSGDSCTARPCAAVGFLGSGLLAVIEIPEQGKLQIRRSVVSRASFTYALQVYQTGDRTLLATAAQNNTGGSRAVVYDVDSDSALDRDQNAVLEHNVFGDAGGSRLVDLVLAPGNRAYALANNEDAVVVLDTRLVEINVRLDNGAFEPALRPAYLTLSALPLQGRPSGIAYVDRAGNDDLLAVVSFDDNALFMLRPNGDSLELDRRFDNVVRGPFQVRHVRRQGRDLLFITGFNDHGVVVFDVTAADPAAWRPIGLVQNDEIFNAN